MANIFENTPLGDLLRRGQMLTESGLFIEIMSRGESQKFVVKLNTDQLRWDYINADGVLLSEVGGQYSPVTVERGNKAGPFKVDLYDTGEFHESFRIENVTGAGFEIKSDPNKGDGTNLLEEWGEKIEGLTVESLDEAASFLLNLYQESIRKKLIIE